MPPTDAEGPATTERALLPLGGIISYRHKELAVVGIFESDGASFESEVWGDFGTLPGFYQRRDASNCLVVRMKDPSQIPALDRWMRNQARHAASSGSST